MAKRYEYTVMIITTHGLDTMKRHGYGYKWTCSCSLQLLLMYQFILVDSCNAIVTQWMELK